MSGVPLIKVSLAIGSLAFLAGCSGAGANLPAQEPSPPEVVSPAGAPVSLLELVPPEANGGALVRIQLLRDSPWGSSLTSMVRRLGAYDWERALAIDLRTEVEQLLIFGVANEARGPGDLSKVLDTMRHAVLGGVIELRPEAVEGGGECTDSELSRAEGQQLAEPATGYSAFRCGRFVILRRFDHLGPLGPHGSSPLAQGLSSSSEGAAPASEAVFVATASPAMVDRVSCGEVTVALAGWQRVSIELEAGMTLRGRYHASRPEDVPTLERCVGDGMGGFASVPLFAQLELSDVLEGAQIARDEANDSDVLLEASFSEAQMDLMMGLLELLGSGIGPEVLGGEPPPPETVRPAQ